MCTMWRVLITSGAEEVTWSTARAHCQRQYPKSLCAFSLEPRPSSPRLYLTLHGYEIKSGQGRPGFKASAPLQSLRNSQEFAQSTDKTFLHNF